MTTNALPAPALRSLRDALLPALVGVVAPHVDAFGWGLVAAAVWGPAPRIAAFLDPTAARPRSLARPVVLLFIAASALGFWLGARR